MENVHFKNKLLFETKLKKIINDGANKLHIVSDFDKTLTQCFVDGKKTPTAFALIRNGEYLKNNYSKKAHDLFNKYNPFEIDDTLDFDFRVQKMKEWWKAHEKLLVESGMHKDIVDDILKKQPKLFRKGATNFLDVLKEKEIPILVFSAGMGNMIEGYLKIENKLTSNVHILSNTFDFDDNGFATKYKDGVIHIFNKSETEVKNKEFLASIKERKNIILLGDIISDLGMSEGLDHDTVITIGFLNENVESKLELYKSKFDVVITNDSDMDFVNEIIEKIK